jgi:hypothetical protein
VSLSGVSSRRFHGVERNAIPGNKPRRIGGVVIILVFRSRFRRETARSVFMTLSHKSGHGGAAVGTGHWLWDPSLSTSLFRLRICMITREDVSELRR